MAKLLALLVVTTALLVPSFDADANATPDHFHPRPGVTFNNPLGERPTRRAIFNRIIRAVDSSPKGSKIKFFTWNFLTHEGTDALLRAQRRGVEVRLLMDASNNEEIPNHPFRRLKAGLHDGNARWGKHRHSWARTCHHSCRGSGGVAHAKYFMFSKVGKVKHVVMQGSANLTLASTNNQWNDTVTHTRDIHVWRFARRTFRQASHDKPVKHPFASHAFGGFRLAMLPRGRSKDPVMHLLNEIRCHNATNTRKHRTRVRIAPDVIRNDRGLALARKIRELWSRGCSIRIGYTVVGVDVGHVLRRQGRRGPVPMRHLVQDFDGDGLFDNYFHLKAMSIVGHIGRDRSGYVVLNGSANWSRLAAVSDENVGIYRNKTFTLQYQDHLDYWFHHFPESRPVESRTSRSMVGSEHGELLFGAGQNAVYEDGTPYSTTGVDPYAHVDVD